MDEVNKVDETTEQAPAEETLEIQEEGAETTETKAPDENIDYKAELEKERNRLKQAEHTIVKLKKKKEDNTEDDFTEEPDLDTKIQEKIQEETRKIRVDLTKNLAKDQAYRIAQSPEEAELILHHYEHSIRHTGEIQTDIENAQALANKGRVVAENSELRKAILKRKVKSPAGSGQRIVKEEEEAPRASAQTVALMQSQGYRWEKGRWVK